MSLSVLDPSSAGDYFASRVTGNFSSKLMQSDMGSYHGFEIDFKPPAALLGNREYRFIADINGPPSWYGASGKPTVQHSGVKFTFGNHWGPTNDNQGQFSEFIFTVP